MGRGRAKAKQQKVARELKYSSHETDLAALQRELAGGSGYPAPTSEVEDDDDNGGDEYEDDWVSATS